MDLKERLILFQSSLVFLRNAKDADIKDFFKNNPEKKKELKSLYESIFFTTFNEGCGNCLIDKFVQIMTTKKDKVQDLEEREYVLIAGKTLFPSFYDSARVVNNNMNIKEDNILFHLAEDADRINAFNKVPEDLNDRLANSPYSSRIADNITVEELKADSFSIKGVVMISLENIAEIGAIYRVKGSEKWEKVSLKNISNNIDLDIKGLKPSTYEVRIFIAQKTNTTTIENIYRYSDIIDVELKAKADAKTSKAKAKEE